MLLSSLARGVQGEERTFGIAGAGGSAVPRTVFEGAASLLRGPEETVESQQHHPFPPLVIENPLGRGGGELGLELGDLGRESVVLKG